MEAFDPWSMLLILSRSLGSIPINLLMRLTQSVSLIHGFLMVEFAAEQFLNILVIQILQLIGLWLITDYLEKLFLPL